jgi:hypothetical protein
MTERESARYRLLRERSWGRIRASVAFSAARKYCLLTDEEHAAREAAWHVDITAKLAAARARDYREKWAPHSELATPDEWAAYARDAR